MKNIFKNKSIPEQCSDCKYKIFCFEHCCMKEKPCSEHEPADGISAEVKAETRD